MIDTRNHDRGTSVTQSYPWGLFVKAKALCPDGKVRSVRLAQCADTFWTVPARLTYRGKTVRGFIDFHDDITTTDGHNQYVRFVPTGKYQDIFTTVGCTVQPVSNLKGVT